MNGKFESARKWAEKTQKDVFMGNGTEFSVMILLEKALQIVLELCEEHEIEEAEKDRILNRTGVSFRTIVPKLASTECWAPKWVEDFHLPEDRREV